MTHYMKLNPEPFSKIVSRKKTIELRLYDEKRKKVKPGDHIVFSKTNHADQSITVEVESIIVAQTFKELFTLISLIECGYQEDEINGNNHIDLDRYYSKEEQAKHKVVGIRFHLISETNNQP